MTQEQRSKNARLHPYDLVFSPSLFEEERFPGIQEEIERRGAAGGDPDAFLLLASVGALLRGVMPEEQVPREVRGEMLRRYGRLLFHAYHFWRAGKNTVELDDASARRLVEETPRVGLWRLRAPVRAGYLRLPRHVFWARVEEGATAEAVDGFFWFLSSIPERAEDTPPESPTGEAAAEEPTGATPPPRLHLLLVLGLRPDRPGFGSIDVSRDVAEAPEGHWAGIDARPGGEDFANVLPGGELDRLHAVTTENEALKLACLAFWSLTGGG